MTDELNITIRESTLWLTLNRPKAMNSLTPTLLLAINEALDAAAPNPAVRAVVLTGAGHAFCAGADLKYVRTQTTEGGAAAVGRFLDRVAETMNRLEQYPVPVIAAVNGLALAGGLELVLCCDLVIAARSAKLGDAHANYGLLPGGGGSVRLPRKIGATRAKYLMFTGDSLPAADLAATGLVNFVVEDAKLIAAVDEVCQKIASKSRPGLRVMKQLVDDGLQQPVQTALRLELLASALHAYSNDLKEGLVAFEQKRRPVFEDS